MDPEQYRQQSNGLARFEVQEEPEFLDLEEMLSEDQRYKKQRLQQELDSIDDQIERRENLHEEIGDELEFKLDLYEKELERMEAHFRGGEEGREEKRKQIRSIRRQLHDEHRKFWNDVQRLEGQKRKLERELASINHDVVSQYLSRSPG